MNDRALTSFSLFAWGMLNTFLPLLLGILSLVGLRPRAAHAAEAYHRAARSRERDRTPWPATKQRRHLISLVPFTNFLPPESVSTWRIARTEPDTQRIELPRSSS
jgi:hypothetical protein